MERRDDKVLSLKKDWISREFHVLLDFRSVHCNDRLVGGLKSVGSLWPIEKLSSARLELIVKQMTVPKLLNGFALGLTIGD